MTIAKQSLTEFYEEKGQVRFMMVVSKEHKAELGRIRKIYGVSQGALLEMFLDLYPAFNSTFENAFENAAMSRRNAKKSVRVSSSALGKKLKGLSKEQLQAIEKIIDEQRANEAEPSGPLSGPGYIGL